MAAAASGRGHIVKCVYHPEAHLAEDYRAGDMICTECGLVVGDRVIDVGRYGRRFFLIKLALIGFKRQFGQ